MSTRCVVNFGYNDEVEAKIYRHSDGYPEGVLPDLKTFFSDVKKQTQDTRFDDPTYLAAKFVVWQANKYAYHYKDGKRRRSKRLDFLSVGVVMQNPLDIEYEYFVNCSKFDAAGFPTVMYKPPLVEA